MSKKSKPKWEFPNGIKIPQYLKYPSPSDIEKLMGITGKTQEEVHAFMVSLFNSANSYRRTKIAETHLPKKSEIRSALSQLQDETSRLLEHLKSADFATSSMLRNALASKLILISDPDKFFAQTEQSLDTLGKALSDAITLAKELPGGRPKKIMRSIFIDDVLEQYEKTLNLKATTTIGGMFEQCLQVVLEFTEDKEIQELHLLVLDAVHARNNRNRLNF